MLPPFPAPANSSLGGVTKRRVRSDTISFTPFPAPCCRACSTAEHTATNIVQAPIACAHRAPRAPRSSLVLPAPHACAPRSSLVLPTPHACAPCFCFCSCSLRLCSPLLALVLPLLLFPAPAPTAPCSLLHLCSLCSLLPLGFSTALGHFRVHTILYLGFASQCLV